MFSSSFIPYSSTSTIIFPFDNFEKQFSKTEYSSSLTGGRATLDEVNEVLANLDTVASNYPSIFQLSLRLSFRLLIFAFIIYSFMDTTVCYDARAPWIAWTTYMVLNLIYLLKTFVSERKEAKKQIENVLKWYQPSFEEKELRWIIPQDFPKFVGIYRDYREKYLEAQTPYNPKVIINTNVNDEEINVGYQPPAELKQN